MQRYNKKCTYASKANIFYKKTIDFIYMFRIHPTIGAMLIIVRMKVVQQGEADFLVENVSDLEYGLHRATV